MSTADLLADLARLGIRLEARGDRLRFHPRSAVTPELVGRMTAHKGELLAILRSAPQGAYEAVDDAGGQYADWIERRGPDGQVCLIHPEHAAADYEIITPPDPCPRCGRLELWQSATGDPSGLSVGKWRCLRCDSPVTARRLRELATRLKSGRPHSRGPSYRAVMAAASKSSENLRDRSS